MSDSQTWLDLLLAHLPPEKRGEASPEIGDFLAGIWAQARQAHPAIDLTPAEFAVDLASALPAGETLGAALRRVRAADLYLACACARGDTAAIESFDREYLARLDGILARFASDRTLFEEARGRVRQMVLFGEKDRGAKIREYGGRGALSRWFRIVATRVALELARRRKKQVNPGDDALMAVPASDHDPEIRFLKERYQREFREVFIAALGSLDAHHRNLLRHHYLDGLTVDELGAAYGIHRATAARRLAKARAQLLAETRRGFLTRLQVGHAEFESIMRLVQSQLDLSIERYLAETQEG